MSDRKFFGGVVTILYVIKLNVFVQTQSYLTSECGCYTARKTCYYHIFMYICKS
nr:MAG TPA: hypothetical protein [Caudoviricetes sp.]